MPVRPIGVSLIAFDGHDLDAALDAIAASGATHAEPAYIDGATDFSEDDLSETAGLTLAARIAAAGLGCVAVSAHINNGADGAATQLIRRLRFARALGAAFLVTNSASADRRDALTRTLAEALPVAEACGVRIALENPGHGPTDLLHAGADAAGLLDAIGSPWVTFNYDVCNVLTCSEGAVSPIADLADGLRRASHLHLKDVTPRDGQWRYTAIGEGSIAYASVLPRIDRGLPLCLELPLRLVRKAGLGPMRGPVLPFQIAQAAVEASVKFVRRGFGRAEFTRRQCR